MIALAAYIQKNIILKTESVLGGKYEKIVSYRRYAE